MALTLPTATRNAMCDALVDLVDGGAGAGYLELQTSGDVEAATVTFSDPAFGASAAGVATANSITDDASAAGGTVDRFRIYDSDATEVLQGSVGTSGEDINLNTLVIAATAVVSISAVTATQPAT